MIPLTGHTSPETAYLVADYPYGFKLRCRIRYWLERHPSRGFRFVSQTSNPKVAGLHWNKPKASTYALLGAAMFLDEEGHVQWRELTPYSSAAEVATFLDTFPAADVSALVPWAVAKARYLERIQSNGPTVDDRGAELAAWRAIVARCPAPAATAAAVSP